ncbi:hypothetical protein EVAR_37541_1 [Eumeta japonica]|uniref:Uncharacterized protein n=1 Tax=Eumeta variegata TaxID=151549 RepID=A0A4C1XV35_EUMVA|nr:hypothetical protein EVAR_37541_1 [Eumeta japonica]
MYTKLTKLQDNPYRWTYETIKQGYEIKSNHALTRDTAKRLFRDRVTSQLPRRPAAARVSLVIRRHDIRPAMYTWRTNGALAAPSAGRPPAPTAPLRVSTDSEETSCPPDPPTITLDQSF